MNPAPDTTRPTSPTYKWWVVGMLWFICFFNYADRQAISVVLPELKREFGFSETQLGLISSAFGYVYGSCALFAGFVADRTARRHLILGGCIFWSFVTVMTGWCSKLWHFVSVRALEGLGETFYFPASMSLVSDYHSKETRSRAMSLHQSSVYAGTVLGSWIGAWLAMHYGWRWGFYLFGAGGLVIAAVMYAFLREPRRGASEPETRTEAEPSPGFVTAVTDVLRSPTAWVLMAVFVGANFVATIFLSWTPKFLTDKFGFKLTTAGLSGAAFIHLASALSAPMAGVLADWLARRHVGGRMLVQAGGLLIGAGFVYMVGSTRDVATLLVCMTCFGVCKGFYDAGIFASLYDVVPARSRATAAGLMNTVGWGLGSFGPFLTGWYADHGPHGSTVENMSHFISGSGAAYAAGAVLLIVAASVWVRADAARATRPAEPGSTGTSRPR
ncbi:MAG: MFS transporter [Verrucomicrobiales bacterium]|nr:MFS transporter [Verrucomicrobiales bacterium]